MYHIAYLLSAYGATLHWWLPQELKISTDGRWALVPTVPPLSKNHLLPMVTAQKGWCIFLNTVHAHTTDASNVTGSLCLLCLHSTNIIYAASAFICYVPFLQYKYMHTICYHIPKPSRVCSQEDRRKTGGKQKICLYTPSGEKMNKWMMSDWGEPERAPH